MIRATLTGQSEEHVLEVMARTGLDLVYAVAYCLAVGRAAAACEDEGGTVHLVDADGVSERLEVVR